MPGNRPAMPPAYRVVLLIGGPIMRRWARMRVTGIGCLPADGPVLVVADHDSYWDPIAIAVAARQVRPVRALAKSSLWKNRVVAAFMNGMGHIPVHRGTSNAEALATAEAELRKGACIGVFPEATRSLGRELRARTGIARLAEAVPEAAIVCVRTTGSVDVVRVPKRPSVTVDFYRPAGGSQQPGESAQQFADRLVAELRSGAPREIPGRRRTYARYHRAVHEPSADELRE